LPSMDIHIAMNDIYKGLDFLDEDEDEDEEE
jgi:hypothetical protein